MDIPVRGYHDISICVSVNRGVTNMAKTYLLTLRVLLLRINRHCTNCTLGRSQMVRE